MIMYLWLRVSNDKYEFPEIIASSVAELADKVGVKTSSIYSSISHSKHDGTSTPYRKVYIEDDEETKLAKKQHKKVKENYI